MYISDYLQDLKKLIKSNKRIKKAEIYGGIATESDLEKFNLDANSCLALISTDGGDIDTKAPLVTTACKAQFIVSVIAKNDRATKGFSVLAQNTAQDLAQSVKVEFAKPKVGLLSKPQLLSLKEIPIDSSKEFSIWYFIYEQSIQVN
ncbi:hypothetical protein AB3A32_002607 [Vibrio alginolyticus]